VEQYSYLTFDLEGQVFGLETDKVLNIIRMCRITNVSEAPYYIKGIAKVQGIIITIVDIKLILGIPPGNIKENNCIILLNVSYEDESLIYGIIVDSIQKIIRPGNDKIWPTSEFEDYHPGLIKGIVESNGNNIKLLETDKILSQKEFLMVKETTQAYEIINNMN